MADLQTKTYTQPALAKKYSVSLSFIEKLKHRQRTTGQCAALPHASGRSRTLGKWETWLRQVVARQPDITLGEVRAKLRRRKRSVKVSESMVCREYQRLRLPRKKKTEYDSERDTPRVQALRRKFQKLLARETRSRWIFIDETGLHLGFTRRYGRAAPGQRVAEACAEHSSPHYTLVAALSQTGIQAPLMFEGAMTSLRFQTYVEFILAPTLQAGDLVLLDNLSSHKGAMVQRLIEARGARVLFLSPYSADFNPIELGWSKAKTVLRAAKAHTWAKLVEAVAEALHSISAQDAQGWFTHCGYPVH